MRVTLISQHTPSLLLSNEVVSTPWPDNILDMSDQSRFFGGYMLVNLYQTTRRYVSDYITLHSTAVRISNLKL